MHYVHEELVLLISGFCLQSSVQGCFLRTSIVTLVLQLSNGSKILTANSVIMRSVVPNRREGLYIRCG
jgi:hypothetical protein